MLYISVLSSALVTRDDGNTGTASALTVLDFILFCIFWFWVITFNFWNAWMCKYLAGILLAFLFFANCCRHCATLIHHVLCCNYLWCNSDSNAMLREKHVNPCVGFDFAYLSIQCDWFWPYSHPQALTNGGSLNLKVNSSSFLVFNVKPFFCKEEIPFFISSWHSQVVIQASHWTNGSSFHLLLLLSLPS